MPPRRHPVNKSDEAARMPYDNALPPTVSRGLIITILLVAIWSPLWPYRAHSNAGDLDQGFGTARGYVISDFARNFDSVFAVATQEDGKIIVAGYASLPNRVFALARYKPDGNLDTGFGDAGKVTTEILPGNFAEIHALALLGDGRILAAGKAGNDFALARYLSNGTIDTSFGTAGKVTTAFEFVQPTVYALAVQGDGRIVAAGGSEYSLALARYQGDGSLDLSFGSGGKITAVATRCTAARGLAIQSDGKILVAGSAQGPTHMDFAVLRFDSSGSPDPTFGSAGRVATDFFDTNNEARGMALLADGRILVAGSVVIPFGSFDFALACYRSDGALDTSFGTAGKVVTNIANDSTGFSYDQAAAVAVDAEGRVLVAGSSTIDNTLSNFTVVRYTGNGSLDTSFGTAGKAIADLTHDFDDAYAMALQKDGKILVAGKSYIYPISDDFALVRYRSDGSLDSSFGPKGKVSTDLNDSSDEAQSLLVQPDGKLVITGRTTSGMALARYLSDGNLDSSFGRSGKVSTDFGALVNNPAGRGVLQSDGKFVLVGSNFNLGESDFAVARFQADGSFDPAFGAGGKVVTGFSNRSEDWATAVALQSDGRILVGGQSRAAGQTQSDFALARYNGDGTPDMSFGTGGKLTTDLFGGSDSVAALLVQRDGRIIAVGTASNSSSARFALARYQSDGRLDTSFGSGGKVALKVSGSSAAAAAALQNDGRIVVVGAANQQFALARFNDDGSLDTSFGDAGKVVTAIASGVSAAAAVALQRNGKIIAAGTAVGQVGTGSWRFALARYNADGSLDPTFGAAGKVTTPIYGIDDRAVAIGFQSDGKIVLAGTALSFMTNQDFALARYDGDGSLGSNFDICLQDQSNGNVMQIDSTTGDYRFTSCATGFVLTGTGTVSANGCQVTLSDRTADHRVLAKVKCLKKASASIEVASTGASYSIAAKKLATNSCVCK
jgi:uncharacterized delta-60 repeat protein